jgi:hypothetical protein
MREKWHHRVETDLCIKLKKLLKKKNTILCTCVQFPAWEDDLLQMTLLFVHM